MAGFRWLARAYAERCFELFAIRVDPRFDTYRDDPRFGPLVRKLGLHVPVEHQGASRPSDDLS